jgi:hypothetical protein
MTLLPIFVRTGEIFLSSRVGQSSRISPESRANERFSQASSRQKAFYSSVPKNFRSLILVLALLLAFESDR